MSRADNRHPDAGPYDASVRIAAQLLAEGERAERYAEATVRSHTLLLEARVKANASGRPGPRVVTGAYRRSINSQFFREAGAFVGQVGTAHPAGRRLEYGFVGADRLGRVYNQPPFAHFGPARLQTGPEFTRAMGRYS